MFNKAKRNPINRMIESNLDYFFRFAYYREGNRTEAEDIVYEAILRFLEKKLNNIKPESARLYLFRIVQNLCRDKSRTEERDLISIDDIEIEDKTAEIPDLEDANRINACLGNLPSREADIIRMNVIDNLSFVEIGNILSIPQSTAKSRFKSGMDKLRKLFTNNKMS